MTTPITNLQSYAVNPANYQTGRGGCTLQAVVLHGSPFEPGDEISLMCRQASAIQHPHQSFHLVVKPSISWAGDFVPMADTAFALSGETNPPGFTPVCPPPGTPDNETYNVLVDWPNLLPDQNCPPVYTSNLAYLCAVLAPKFVEMGIEPSETTLLIAAGELPGLDYSALLACLIEAYNAPVPGVVNRACLPPHPLTTNQTLPLVAWDGNCLAEITHPALVEACDYLATVNVTEGGKVTSVTIGGHVYYATGGGILETDVNAIRTWLNGLGVGTFGVAYAFGVGGTATLTISLIQSVKPFTSVLATGGAVTPVQSNCNMVNAQVPVTVQDALAQLSITYASGIISVNGVPLVTGTAIYDMGGTLLGYAMPV